MIGYSIGNTIFIMVLMSSVMFLVLGAGIMLIQKYRKFRINAFLSAAIIFLMQAFGIIGILLTPCLHHSVTAAFDKFFRPLPIVLGMLMAFVFQNYLLELKRPGWFTVKKALFFSSPFLVLTILLALHIGNFTEISSLNQLSVRPLNPDVVIRILICILYPLYFIAVILVPTRSCTISVIQLITMEVLSLLISVASVFGLFMGVFPAMVINFFCINVLDCYIAYVEFKERIPVTPEASIPVIGVSEEVSVVKPESNDSVDVDKQMHPYFDNPQIWMDPEMSANQLAHIMGTNSSYLSKEIKAMGYLNYSDMINRHRIEFVCDRLKSGESSINQITRLMFESGFRSRSTATGEFKRIVGCTPSEFFAKYHNHE